MASETPVWKGWAGLDEQSTKGNLVFEEFEPKAWEEDDIEGKWRYVVSGCLSKSDASISYCHHTQSRFCTVVSAVQTTVSSPENGDQSHLILFVDMKSQGQSSELAAR
jgi:hypothetical protein